ncbi:MAG: tRNA(Ile)-lysidine synthase [Gammaproteobacteria bacterium]
MVSVRADILEQSPTKTLGPDVLAALQCAPPATRFLVACSGGADSVALLDALCEVRHALAPALLVVHINHGLHPRSSQWEKFVRELCDTLHVPCIVRRVSVSEGAGLGLEAAARAARYEALGQLVDAGDVVLTAHHRDDQAETMLLNLLRGAGPRGLAGMRAVRPFAKGHLARPCLAMSRDDLREHCRARGRMWVDDSSNSDTQIRRNFLRHEVLPVLERHWPGAAATLSRAALLQRGADELLGEIANRDLAQAYSAQSRTLDVSYLMQLSTVRGGQLVRAWTEVLGLPTPSLHHVSELLRTLDEAREEAQLSIQWPGAVVTRFRRRLYARSPQAKAQAKWAPMRWVLSEPLTFARGVLRAHRTVGSGLSVRLLEKVDVEVRRRTGGERLRPAGRGLTKRVKSLLQEAALPPWEREQLPLLFVAGQLAAIPGVCYSESFAASAGEEGWEIEWLPNT